MTSQSKPKMERCPTCGSNRRNSRNAFPHEPGWAYMPCHDPWHTSSGAESKTEQPSSERCPTCGSPNPKIRYVLGQHERCMGCNCGYECADTWHNPVAAEESKPEAEPSGQQEAREWPSFEFEREAHRLAREDERGKLLTECQREIIHEQGFDADGGPGCKCGEVSHPLILIHAVTRAMERYASSHSAGLRKALKQIAELGCDCDELEDDQLCGACLARQALAGKGR